MNRTLTLALLLGASSYCMAQSAASPPLPSPDASALAASTPAAPTSASAGATSAGVAEDASKAAAAPSSVIYHIATPLIAPTVVAPPVAESPTQPEPASSESIQSESIQPEPALSDLAPPAHPATPAQIRELLQLTHAAERARAQMAATLKLMRASSPAGVPAAFWDDMQRAMANLDIVTPCIPAYQKYYSQQDMAVALAFYHSLAGRRMMAAEPYVSSILSDTLRQAGERVGAEVGLKYKGQIGQPPSGLDVVVTSN